jgi:hypothetical protein
VTARKPTVSRDNDRQGRPMPPASSSGSRLGHRRGAGQRPVKLADKAEAQAKVIAQNLWIYPLEGRSS